jgi:hypothetical protein
MSVRLGGIRASGVTVALGVAAVAILVAGPALAAPAGGTIGDPQPELAPFSVGPAGGSGSGTVLPDGTLVLAATSASGTSIHVCELHPGARACANTVTLAAYPDDSFYGTPEVLSLGGPDFSIVAEDCCNIGVNGAVTFNTTDGGATFAGEKVAGNISSIGTATVADGQLVAADYTSASFNVQAFPPSPATPQTTYATPNSHAVGTSALTTYDGGVLAANDDLTNTYVEYAASGSDFNASGSYKSVATFANEDTVALSGNALLTDPKGSLTGGDVLRFFDGTSFGKAYKVPDSKAGDDGYFAMQDTDGTVNVFFLGRRDSYDLFEDSTRNGVTWTQRRFASAITSADLVPVLAGSGIGVVYEADSSSHLLAQPILDAQSVRISLKHSHVRAGQSTKLTGSVSPRLKNQLVTLEQLKGKRWYTVKTSHESATGKFSFTVPGVTRTYRAVVADKPGYYEYGYSNSAKLTA